MYPGDVWDFNSHFCNKASLEKYSESYDLSKKLFRAPLPPVPDDELIQLSSDYLNEIHLNNSKFVIKLLTLLPQEIEFKKIRIRLMDSDFDCTFDLVEGLKFNTFTIEPEVSLSSRSLAFIFKFQWGIGTIYVNGRFRATKNGEINLRRIFHLGKMNSIGRYLTIPYIASKMLQKCFNLGSADTDDEFSLHKSWESFLSKLKK